MLGAEVVNVGMLWALWYRVYYGPVTFLFPGMRPKTMTGIHAAHAQEMLFRNSDPMFYSMVCGMCAIASCGSVMLLGLQLPSHECREARRTPNAA